MAWGQTALYEKNLFQMKQSNYKDITYESDYI